MSRLKGKQSKNKTVTASSEAVVAPVKPKEEERHLSSLNKELYKRNLELAVKNKTLSLLGKLYEISVLALEPDELSEKLTSIIQNDFGFEFVGILVYDKQSHELTPLQFSESNQFKAMREAVFPQFSTLSFKSAEEHSFFGRFFKRKTVHYTEKIADIWGKVLDPAILKKVQADTNLRSILSFPLVTQSSIIGILLLGMNQTYRNLIREERDSIKSFVNVIAVALDKALVYKRLKELDQLKSEFISLATHQIRAPLTAILGYISLILDGDFGEVPEKIRQPLTTVLQSSQSLVTIVGDFLDVSRIEQGRMVYDKKEFNMDELVVGVVNALKPNVEQKKLGISFDVEGEKDYKIFADQGKIKQVIGNVIDNSIKYTQRGSISVRLSRQGKNVRVSISDTGVGIAKEEIPNLFAKFSRTKDAHAVSTSGTGLGLYVARQMVEAHNGKIWVESKGKGMGSQFYIELPASQ